MTFAHGVGTVYESPIPLPLYVLGAAAAVLFSFVVRALSRGEPRPFVRRTIAGEGIARVVAIVLRWSAVAVVVLLLASGIAARSEGASLAVLLFWVALVVGGAVVSSAVAGAWDAADPWARAQVLLQVDDPERVHRAPPVWLGPLLVYLLFWFELVSGVGFEDVWVVVAVLVYSTLALSFRPIFGARWAEADPLAILFGFASRIAPLELHRDHIVARSSVAGLDEDRPMPLPLYGSVFVLLGSTTLDNVRETVGWTAFVGVTRLDAVPPMILDSLALVVFALLFWSPFALATTLASASMRSVSRTDAARRFGWSLVPIGIAYVLAHNAPLLITGIPAIVRELADPFALGWDVVGLSRAFSGFIPSARAVWFIEIGLIVGGHILGVLAAHRAAVRLGDGHRAAVRSQYALTLLMTVYTIATLWLLAQPLVV